MSCRELILLLAVFTSISCNNKSATQPSADSKPEVIYFTDLVNVNEIDSVLMINSYGSHLIESSKLEKFKAELSKTTLHGGSYKMGGIGFSIYMNNKEYFFSGRTHGTYIEATYDIVSKNKSWIDTNEIHFNSIFFEAKGMNLDNY
jgi:hypothetical protein